MVPESGRREEAEMCIPFRLESFGFLNVNVLVAVVGVCGGEACPALFAKLYFGVVGRMAGYSATTCCQISLKSK